MPLDEHTAFHLANLFSALSDSTRIRIIDLLLEGEPQSWVYRFRLDRNDRVVSLLSDRN